MYGSFSTGYPVKPGQALLASGHPICLYADAVRALETDASWQSFHDKHQAGVVLACTSAATRRQITQTPRPGLRWTSLPDMYQALAKAQGLEQIGVHVTLRAGAAQPLALTEALDALLAALALDWPATLLVATQDALLALEKIGATDAAKGYASLPLFGLAQAQLAPGLVVHAPLLLPIEHVAPTTHSEAVLIAPTLNLRF
jgi:hypothetical protein